MKAWRQSQILELIDLQGDVIALQLGGEEQLAPAVGKLAELAAFLLLVLPLRIKAVKEGSVVAAQNAIITIENTDPEFHWLTNYLETLLLKVWYPTTVATLSREIKKIIKGFLERTGDPALHHARRPARRGRQRSGRWSVRCLSRWQRPH